MKRPYANGSTVTTPHTGEMMRFLGAGATSGNITLSRDEFENIKKIYGYKKEKPNKKPPPPEAPPKGASFAQKEDYEKALKHHENWEDPIALLQAGADRNAIRHAEADGLRMLAWIAKFVPQGEDPLKTLVNLAVAVGLDVDPSDSEWAEDEGEEASEEE